MSGFQTGLGVSLMLCTHASRSPATQEPLVPSTWIVSRSSRRTRVHQLELNWQSVPSSSWKIA